MRPKPTPWKEEDVATALAFARSAGFSDAAVASLDDLADRRISDWLDRGFHGEMKYLERFLQIRKDPRAAYPPYGAALVAFAEYGDSAPAPRDPLLGNVARYALGGDYHVELKARLRAVQRDLRHRYPKIWTRPFVDSGPLNEKLAAEASGLGWVGKHTNVILRKRGSYGVLGVLLLGVELPARPTPAKDYCGLCTRCIDACPTKAIVAPYQLDARLCISYLTIELQGPIPTDLRPMIGNRIFGCDDCQEACPWNRFATREPEEAFRPRDGLQGRSLVSWLGLDADSFAETFASSAVLRAGYPAFVRNVLVALGNAGRKIRDDAATLRAVEERLRDASPVVRGAAAWALGRIGGPGAVSALNRRADIEDDSEVLRERTEALRSAQEPPNPNESGPDGGGP